MPLLKDRYLEDAVHELDMYICMLEGMSAAGASRSNPAPPFTASEISSIVSFSRRIELITDDQSESFLNRIEKYNLNRDLYDLDDGLENPRECAARYRGMDDYIRMILEKRSIETPASGTSSKSETPQDIDDCFFDARSYK